MKIATKPKKKKKNGKKDEMAKGIIICRFYIVKQLILPSRAVGASRKN